MIDFKGNNQDIVLSTMLGLLISVLIFYKTKNQCVIIEENKQL